jgi:hypothetical protein
MLTRRKLLRTEDAMSPMTDADQVKLLFEYTKFHIGMYTTLATLFVALLGTEYGKALRVRRWLIWVAVVFILMAGLAGGVIASTLPHRRTLDEFMHCGAGPYRLERVAGEWWTYIEHTTFWLAVLAVLLAFWFPYRQRTVRDQVVCMCNAGYECYCTHQTSCLRSSQ